MKVKELCCLWEAFCWLTKRNLLPDNYIINSLALTMDKGKRGDPMEETAPDFNEPHYPVGTSPQIII